MLEADAVHSSAFRDFAREDEQCRLVTRSLSAIRSCSEPFCNLRLCCCGVVRLGDKAACAKKIEISPRSSLQFPLDRQIYDASGKKKVGIQQV